MLLLANVVFFIGSLICAVSVDVQMLLAGRVLQGIGGGGLIILVNIVISDLFSMRCVLAYFGWVCAARSMCTDVGLGREGFIMELWEWYGLWRVF